MIEKMQFLSISGPIDDLDDMLKNHLADYEIHLENAMLQLKDLHDLHPLVLENPYKEPFLKVDKYCKLISKEQVNSYNPKEHIFKNFDDLNNFVEMKCQELLAKTDTLATLKKQKIELEEKKANITHFLDLDCNISDILKFKYISFCFGRMPIIFHKKYEEYVYNSDKAIFLECSKNDEELWGVYFCLKPDLKEVEKMFSNLHFEKYIMPEEFIEHPKKIFEDLTKHIDETSNKIASLEKDIADDIKLNAKKLMDAKNLLMRYSRLYDVGQMGAIIEENEKTYYIICGWLSKMDAVKLSKEISTLPKVVCTTGEKMQNAPDNPPTKLRNFKIFKPFEALIKMYGLPAYTEIDPTFFVAITYSFIFGAMFGDVGQGLGLVLLGGILYFIKKIKLFAIISCAGIFSTFFGFLYGSVFGFEDMIEAIWIKPILAMSNLALLGKLNTIFVISILFGIGLIFIAMIFNIINCIKNKEIGKLITDQNAITGMVFYASAVTVLILAMIGKTISAGIVLILLFVIPLIILLLKEPLSDLIDRKQHKKNGSIGMFFVESFFEVFEILLSYFSNTLSFVRIGAFAVSHAAMMEVVMMLSGAEKGSLNIIGVIIGNIFICAMEGFIVGIQVLRLEYYEMFSRFYKGSGREFIPFFIQDKLGGIK